MVLLVNGGEIEYSISGDDLMDGNEVSGRSPMSLGGSWTNTTDDDERGCVDDSEIAYYGEEVDFDGTDEVIGVAGDFEHETDKFVFIGENVDIEGIDSEIKGFTFNTGLEEEKVDDVDFLDEETLMAGIHE